MRTHQKGLDILHGSNNRNKYQFDQGIRGLVERYVFLLVWQPVILAKVGFFSLRLVAC